MRGVEAKWLPIETLNRARDGLVAILLGTKKVVLIKRREITDVVFSISTHWYPIPEIKDAP